DMQEDKEAVFDCIDTVKQCLEIIDPMFDTLTVCQENMAKAALHGFINATDCADYLVKKGLPFRDAYHVIGTLVGYCSKQNKSLNDCTLTEFKQFHPLFESDVYEALDLKTCVQQRNVLGGPSSQEVQRQIQVIECFIKGCEVCE
ncbi:MAG: argininosuccinate lyase, partial [Floccifex sp.]